MVREALSLECELPRNIFRKAYDLYTLLARSKLYVQTPGKHHRKESTCDRAETMYHHPLEALPRHAVLPTALLHRAFFALRRRYQPCLTVPMEVQMAQANVIDMSGCNLPRGTPKDVVRRKARIIVSRTSTHAAAVGGAMLRPLSQLTYTGGNTSLLNRGTWASTISSSSGCSPVLAFKRSAAMSAEFGLSLCRKISGPYPRLHQERKET